MGIDYKQGTFTKATATGDQDITTVGFQPKALTLWGILTTGETFVEHYSVSYGFTDGTNDMVVTSVSEDNQASSDSGGTLYNDACIMLCDPTTAAYDIVGRATLSTFLSNGFRLNWSVANATAYVIHYTAIGGSDITNVLAGTRNVTAAAAGNQGYTGVGFQPDFLLTANGGVNANTAPTTTRAFHSGLGISAMKSTSARWSVSNASERGRTTMDTWRYQRTDKCFTILLNSSGALDAEADFVSFDSDGLTWNYTTTSAAAAVDDFIFLTIKGGVWDIANATAPTSNSTTTINTDASATFKGIQLVSVENTTNASIVAHCAMAIGGCDASNNQGVTTYYDTDNAADSVIAMRQNDNNCMYMMVANATATSSTVLDVGTGTAAAHSIDIAWTNTDASARQFVYWALSEAAVAVVTEEPSFKSFGSLGITNTTGNTIFG